MQDRRLLTHKRARLLRTRRLAVGGGGAATNLIAATNGIYVGYSSGGASYVSSPAVYGSYTGGLVNGFELNLLRLRPSNGSMNLGFEGDARAALSGATLTIDGEELALPSASYGSGETHYTFYGVSSDLLIDGQPHTISVA